MTKKLIKFLFNYAVFYEIFSEYKSLSVYLYNPITALTGSRTGFCKKKNAP